MEATGTVSEQQQLSGSVRSEVVPDQTVAAVLLSAEQYRAAVELVRGTLESDIEEAIATWWELREEHEQVEAQIDGKRFKLQVPKRVAEVNARGEATLEAAINQWQCAVEGRVAAAALEVRCAEQHLSSAFFRNAPDGSIPEGSHLALLDRLLAGACEAAKQCPTTFRLLRVMATYVGASHLAATRGGDPSEAESTECREQLLNILQRHPLCLPWSCVLLQPTASELLPQLQMLVKSHQALYDAQSSDGGKRREDDGERTSSAVDEAPLLVEDYCQSLETLLHQMPWDGVAGEGIGTLQQQFLPAIASLFDILLDHSQDPMGVPSAMVTVARILAIIVDRCEAQQKSLLLPVANLLSDARWPVPVFLPLMLPVLPIHKADAATLRMLLSKLLRLEDEELLTYAEKPATDRQDARRMLQCTAVEGRSAVSAVYHHPLFEALHPLPPCKVAPHAVGLQARPALTGPCNFPVLAAIRQLATCSALASDRVCGMKELELVAAELTYHACMGDAAIACTAAVLQSSGSQPESAPATTARRFCDEALMQLSALCGAARGAWALALEALSTNCSLIQSNDTVGGQILPSSQAFAARLGAVLAVLLPHVADSDWMTGDCGTEGGTFSSAASNQGSSTILNVERGMRALVKLSSGYYLEELSSSLQTCVHDPEATNEGEAGPTVLSTTVPEAAQQILPWVAAVWVGTGQQGSDQPLAFLQLAAQLASAAPWTKGSASLSPLVRLRCLLTVLSAHCHLVSGQPTEGGVWLWRFVSGPGGQQLTTLLSADAPNDDLILDQATAESLYICSSSPPDSCPIELQLLWGLVRLQVAAGLVERWAVEARVTGESSKTSEKCRAMIEDISWWTRASQLVDAGLGETLVPLVARLVKGLAGFQLSDCAWAASATGTLLAAMMATDHSSTPSAVAMAIGERICALRGNGEEAESRAVVLWLKALCLAVVHGNETAEAAICAILAEVVGAAWVASHGAIAAWPCWAWLVETLNEVELSQMAAQLHAVSERPGNRSAGWLALLRVWMLQASGRQLRDCASVTEDSDDRQASTATESQVESILQSYEAAQAVPLEMPVCLPLWLAFSSEYFRLQESVKEIVDREEVGMAFLKLGGWFESAGKPLLAAYCTQAAALDPTALPQGTADGDSVTQPDGCLPDSEHWLEYEQLHHMQLLEQHSVASDARSSSEVAPSAGGNASNRVSQEGGGCQVAKTELLSLSPKPLVSVGEALAELKELTCRGEGRDTLDAESDLVELQSWGRRGQKQATDPGKTAQRGGLVDDLRTSVGDGEGDVPHVLSRCQVALWEANMAVQSEMAPINEQLRELLRMRYSEQMVAMPGTVDIGQGERRRVNIQVKSSKEMEGWQSLLASNRQAAEQSITLGLLEAQFMSDAAGMLEALESTLERVGLTQTVPNDATDGEDMWELRQQLCMVLCDVLIDGSTPPLGLLPLRRLFVQAARQLASARPIMQPDLVSHMLLLARRCAHSENIQTPGLNAVVKETVELMRSWLEPSQLLDADGSKSEFALNAFSGCLRALLHNGSVLPAGTVHYLLEAFDVQRYVAAEMGAGIVDSDENTVAATGAAPDRLERAFMMAGDALRLPGAEDMGCQLLEAIVCIAPSQHFAACLAVTLATPAGREDARKQALDMLAKLPFEILSPNVTADVLRSILAALKAGVLSPPYIPYDLLQALLQSPSMVALLEGRGSVPHPSARAEWSADVARAKGYADATGGVSAEVGAGSEDEGGAECCLVRVRSFPHEQSEQLISDLLEAILQKLTCLYNSVGSSGLMEELTSMLSAWISAAANSEVAMNLAWRHYCNQWQPFLALTGALTQGAVAALFSSFWNGLPWSKATFHLKGARALASLREQLPQQEGAALEVIRGLRWSEFMDNLKMQVGILSSAGINTEDECCDIAEARDLATQAALLAIDAYLMVGAEGVPAWVANLLAVDLSTVGDEEVGDLATSAEGLQMKQLLAVADWAVLEALLCPQLSDREDEEEKRKGAAIDAGMPAGQSYGFLRPLLAAPARVAPGLDNRLLQVAISLKDTALMLRDEHACAVAASAAHGILLVSIGPSVPPTSLTASGAAAPSYWHLAEDHQVFVMQRVMMPLVAEVALPDSSSPSVDVTPDIPTVIALKAAVGTPVLHEAVESLSFACSTLPLGACSAGKCDDSKTFVEKMQAHASSWLSHIHVRRGKGSPAQSDTPAKAIPTPAEVDQQSSGPQVALQAALLGAAKVAKPRVCLKLACAAQRLAMLPASPAPHSLTRMADAFLKCALDHAKSSSKGATAETLGDDSVQLQMVTDSSKAEENVNNAQQCMRAVSPLTAALQCMADLPLKELAVLSRMAAEAGAPLTLALVIEQQRREAMSADDKEWQVAVCTILRLAADSHFPPATSISTAASMQPNMLLLWLAVLSWLADARWSRVGSTATSGQSNSKDPESALLLLLEVMERQVTILKCMDAASVSKTADSRLSRDGMNETDKHTKVGDRLKNVTSGISSFLHAQPKGEPGESDATVASDVGPSEGGGDSKGKASARFNFGSLKSSLGEAAKAGQGMSSSLKQRFKEMGVGGKSVGGGGNPDGPKSSGGLVFPKGTTVPLMETGIDTQMDLETVNESPALRDANQLSAADSQSQDSFSSASSDAMHRAKGAMAGGFRAFMNKLDKLPGGGQEAHAEGAGLVAGLADRFRGIAHGAIRGVRGSGAESGAMATEAIAVALAAHAIVSYVRNILCPALQKSTKRHSTAAAQTSNATPGESGRAQNPLSMSYGDDALLTEMDQVLAQRGTLDELLELQTTPLVAANPAPFNAFFEHSEALLSHSTSVERLQSLLPRLLFPSDPHLCVFDSEMRLQL